MTPIETLDRMNKDERSLLLFLETQAVDGCGLVGSAHMNTEDMEIAGRWADSGFIRFSRMLSEFLGTMPSKSHVVVLSGLAWECAGIERRRRAERVLRTKIVMPSLEHFEGQRKAGAA
jgi:hypothetical protein